MCLFRVHEAFGSGPAQTTSTWGRAVAPFAEWVARAFWSTTRKPDRPLATRLTQDRRRKAKPSAPSHAAPAPSAQSICHGCGKAIAKGTVHCAACAVGVSRQRMTELARLGRVASKTLEARARVGVTQHRQATARYSWQQSRQPDWLTEQTYTEKIKPRLVDSSISEIATALEISISYAASIRVGRRSPHPRHWHPLAKLAGITADE